MPEGNQPQGQQQQNASPDWRNLEQSRDKFKESSEQWRNLALKRTVAGQGFDPEKGVGKLLLDAFIQEHPDLTPDQVDDTFNQYVEQVGIEPPTPEGGDGGDGNTPTPAEQLMQQAQQQGQDLQNLSQPPEPSDKPIPVQIAEAQQAGDHEKVQELSFALATQQFVQNAQGAAGQAPQQPTG